MRVKVGTSRTIPAISLEAIGPQFIPLALLFLSGLFLFPSLPYLSLSLVLGAFSLSLIPLFEKMGFFVGTGLTVGGVAFSLYSGQSWQQLLFYLPIFFSFWVSLKIKQQAAAVAASSIAAKEAQEKENREKKRELELLLKRVKEEPKSSLSSLQEAREEQIVALEKRHLFFQERNLQLRRALDEREQKIAFQGERIEELSYAATAKEEIDDLIAEGNRVRGLLFAQESLLEEAMREVTRLREELRLRPKREEPLDLHFFHLYKQLRVQFLAKEEELHVARSELFIEKDALEAQQRLLEETLFVTPTWEEELLSYARILEEELSLKELEIANLEAILSSRWSMPYTKPSDFRIRIG